MVKLTKRKGFNFFRSYYDVYNELENDTDKLAFIDALLDRQFLGIKPTELIGMAKFAYISQTNSIDSQVKGYEDKTKTKLNPTEPVVLPPTEGGCVRGEIPPSLQEKEKEKEKEILHLYKKFVDEVKNNNFDSRIENMYMRLKIKKGSLTPLLKDFKSHIIEENRLHKNTEEYFINFKNWLNTQERVGMLKEYKLKSAGAL
ncbi:MAG: hypothetical protein GY928_02190 [Colwellia sp.]|nr:hypothetical protein [Colwellia sp.]